MLLEKLNLEKTDRSYYNAKKEPEIVELGEHFCLTISGHSDPNDAPFMEAIETLYSVAYSIKFNAKAKGRDFKVPKMEGYWWIEGGIENQHNFMKVPKNEWHWKIALRMPDFIEETHFFQALAEIKDKKPLKNPEKIKFEMVREGKCVQILHIGPYEAEEPTLMRLFEFVKKQNLEITGYHHEIYISDPRKTTPEKLKTILRYQVA